MNAAIDLNVYSGAMGDLNMYARNFFVAECAPV